MLSKPDFKQKHIVYAFISHGEKLSFKNDNLILKSKDGEVKLQTSCYQVFVLFMVGHFSITSGVIQRAQKFSFSIYHLSHNLKFINAIITRVDGNFLLREKQYHYNKLNIAQSLVKNKIHNQLVLLKKQRNKTDELKKAIQNIQSYTEKLSEPPDLQSILGIEGIASRLYFQHHFSDCNWKSRKPRVKHDPINTLLDIGYSMLFNIIESLLNLYGFDTYKGVYHTNFYQRKSLVCDLVEPFRCIIDAKIKNAQNLGQIKETDFTYRKGQYHLNHKEAKPYIQFLLTELMNYKIPMFDYIQLYYRAFMKNKSIEDYPFYNHGKKSCS